MAPATLNYAILRRKEFEVYPFYIHDDAIWIKSFLETVCSQRGGPHLQEDAHFWLVGDSTTLNYRYKGRLTFLVEKPNSIR